MNPSLESNDRKVLIYSTLGLVAILILTLLGFFILSNRKSSVSLSFDYPKHWDKAYVENADDYEEVFNGEVVEDFYTQQSFDAINTSTSLRISYSPKSTSRTLSDEQIAQLSEGEAWEYISNGIWTSYQTSSFAQNKSKLVELQRSNTETITVNVWYWANPGDATDLSKTTKTKTFAVNSKLADVFTHIFEDIYNDPSQPVINIADKGMGTWVLRGKNHNSSNTMSAHSLGCAIDINPSTGSFKLNGKWYGNGYKHSKMSFSTWQQLPECHTKYHVLYDGCPIVEIFKSYGFYWGGDWNTTPDCMHLAYIGDGSTARAKGIENYNSRQ